MKAFDTADHKDIASFHSYFDVDAYRCLPYDSFELVRDLAEQFELEAVTYPDTPEHVVAVVIEFVIVAIVRLLAVWNVQRHWRNSYVVVECVSSFVQDS